MPQMPDLVETRNETVKDRKRVFLLNRSESGFYQETLAPCGRQAKSLYYEVSRQAIRASHVP